MANLSKLLRLYAESTDNLECAVILSGLRLNSDLFRESYSQTSYYLNFHLISDFQEYKKISESLGKIRSHIKKLENTDYFKMYPYYKNCTKRKLGKLRLRMMRIEENVSKL